MNPPIPNDLVLKIRQLARNGGSLAEVIEDEAYDWVDQHPKTLWTALELVDVLKQREAELFAPFLA